MVSIVIVPGFQHNLLPIQLVSKGCKVIYEDGVANIQMNDMVLITFFIEQTCSTIAKVDNMTLWHKILGHIGNKSFKSLCDLVDGNLAWINNN